MIVLMQTDLPDPVAPRDQHVRHVGQVGDHRVAGHVPAECNRQSALRRHLQELRRFDQAAQRHDSRVCIGHLDANDRLPRHGRLDPNRRRRQRQVPDRRPGA